MQMGFGKLTNGSIRNLTSSRKFTVVNGTYSLKSSDGTDLSIATGSAPPNASSENSYSVNSYLSHFSDKNYGNTVLGSFSQFNRTTSAGNTIVGWYSMHNNISGSGNTTNGWFSMFKNTTGNSNVAMGVGCAYNNNGNDNVFLGANSGYENTGNENVFSGSYSGYKNTGSNNTFIGYKCGYTGSNGNNNTFLGNMSGFMNNGNGNTYIGHHSSYTNNSGNDNVSIGKMSGYNNTGNNNVNIGSMSGYNNTGNNNVFIGANSDYSIPNTSNIINIGNESINLFRCSVYSITTPADNRDKKSIAILDYGFEFIDKLKPVSFLWDRRDGKKNNIKSCGLLAQDLKIVLDSYPSSNDTLNLLNDKDPNNLEITYGNFIPILIKACKQYSDKIILANLEIVALKKRVDDLEKQVSTFKPLIDSLQNQINSLQS